MGPSSGSPPVDVELLIPGIGLYARTATRLHPRRGVPQVDGSHVGGPLLWPADEPWPLCRETHMTFVRTPRGAGYVTTIEPTVPDVPVNYVGVAQLRSVDVPDLWCPPGTDLLQVLWCPNIHLDGCPAVRLRWRKLTEVAGPLLDPPVPNVVEFEEYLPRYPCVIHPEQVVEFPFHQELPPDLEAAVGQRFGEDPDYQYVLSIAPGWKVGGWASWHSTDIGPMDCPRCAVRMPLFLSIDSCEWDGGSGPRWRPVEERHLADGTPECSATYEPTGIVVGRFGLLNVFVCRTCPDAPLRANIQ